jgi:hypothetical protein
VKKLPDRTAKAMKRAILRFPTVKMKAMWSSISKAVEQKTICGFFDRSTRILEAYRDGIQYGCEKFKNRVYIITPYRRIEDRSTW